MKVSDLKPNELNPRQIDDWHLDTLGKSLKKFGDLGCIVFNRRSGKMVGGHQRLKSLPPDSPVTITTNYLTPTQTWTVAEGFVEIDGEKFKYREVDVDEQTEKAMNIAANKHGGEWNLPKLNDWLLELDQENYDMDLTGFSPEELEDAMAPIDYHGNADEDEVPGVPEIPKSKLGDIYQLGEHRLMCGDSVNIQHVEALMNGEKADMIFTDPPCNVNYVSESRATRFSPDRLKNKHGKIKNDDKSPEEFIQFLDDVYTSMSVVLNEGASVYICHADTSGHLFRNAFIAQPWLLKSCLIWKKSALILGSSDYQWIHEPILYGWKEGKSHNWYGDRKQTTVLEFSADYRNKKESDTDGYVHLTQKPVALIDQVIKNSSLTNNLLFEPFGGSGSTIIACEKTSRRCFTMELDPKYCDVIISRWEKFSGKKAELLNG